MIRSFSVSLLSVALLAACSPAASNVASAPLPQEQTFIGSVSAADPRAEEAGMKMLRAGGSATDAAIAVMLALTVVEPQSSGIGGGGFYVRGTADGAVKTIDGRETAPDGAVPEWFLDESGELLDYSQSVLSGLSIGVPGNVALAAKAHAEHGRLPWAQLFEPAIRLTRDGFEMNVRLHESLKTRSERAGHSDFGKALYFGESGEPLPVGTLIVNPALAETFEQIATQGPDAFYQGAFAELLASHVAAATPRKGAMTASDLDGYVAKQREAVCGMYRAYRVCGMGPPSSGGVAVQQILGQLERFDLNALGLENPATWHLFLESQRIAYADRELYLADSDFIDVPVKGLIDPAYLARRSALIDPASRIADPQPGTPEGARTALADGNEAPESGTTHFSVVGQDGTMISYTSTIEGAFGSGLMFGGFHLNNELTDFSRSPEIDGIPVANRVEGGKRPRSSMAPTMVWDPQGRPFMVVGAAGGPTIPVQTARSIIGAIDFGLSAEQALGMPFLMAFGDRVLIEEGTWLEEQAEEFKALGHEQLIIRAAPVKAGALLRHEAGWESARDPRLEGKLGYLP
ncbi:gamma-glutamyltransferase [Altererythrobacter sp. MF3-039]|uniref:gamma-glutamyltransferase n=1 Tax=Altererythrobacter sp. MF3-039 TaxID=3252901 RepID=UPI00390CA602